MDASSTDDIVTTAAYQPPGAGLFGPEKVYLVGPEAVLVPGLLTVSSSASGLKFVSQALGAVSLEIKVKPAELLFVNQPEAAQVPSSTPMLLTIAAGEPLNAVRLVCAKKKGRGESADLVFVARLAAAAALHAALSPLAGKHGKKQKRKFFGGGGGGGGGSPTKDTGGSGGGGQAPTAIPLSQHVQPVASAAAPLAAPPVATAAVLAGAAERVTLRRSAEPGVSFGMVISDSAQVTRYLPADDTGRSPAAVAGLPIGAQLTSVGGRRVAHKDDVVAVLGEIGQDALVSQELGRSSAPALC
eukprot:SAG22_NODE_53_length_24242_cov_158.884231_26_plen_300_part_00